MSRPPGTEAIVERHLSVHEVLLEMHVGRLRRQALSDARQREVMSRHQADGAVIDEEPQHSVRTLHTIVRVRAMEQLVQQKQQGA